LLVSFILNRNKTIFIQLKKYEVNKITKIERYGEIEVTVNEWEYACYWCGLIFNKSRQNDKRMRFHYNIQYETKVFCCNDCKLKWIDYKQTLGELMP